MGHLASFGAISPLSRNTVGTVGVLVGMVFLSTGDLVGYVTMLCTAEQEPGNPVTSILSSVSHACLRTACRATPDPYHPSKDAPQRSRSANGPTTIRDVPIEIERRADYAGPTNPRDLRSITRGTRGKPTHQVVSELSPLRGSAWKRAPVRVEAPSKGHRHPRS